MSDRVDALTADDGGLDPRQFDYRRLRLEATTLLDDGGCPNGPDPETGEWPCDPKGYFGIAECQVCGRIGRFIEHRGNGRA